ncbi:MAG TPA: DEAD/DEAH box helicase, partial [Candidatus Limnocylindrales bacterium]|nr:DEAD/DEAH box helicase [Candidatus Limnocylindrales bacterium]
TATDKATWLVAHLLDWHRREDKSTYWRFFDLMSKSDEELIEEGEPIGGLELTDEWELPKPSKSKIYRYTFPAQDFKIDVGHSLNDPRLYAAGEKRTGTGSVHAVDDTALTLDIKRGRDWAGPHPTSVVGLDVIDAKAQRTAIMRLAEWVVTNGMESEAAEWHAARDLLLRQAPRLSGRSGGKLVSDDRSGSEAAVEIALQLNGTTLAIQGPPGSGKTYTGARMIWQLIDKERVVGVTSNSHKVIGNLVKAAIDTVPEGKSIRIVQKAKAHEAVEHPWVKRVDANEDVDEAIAEGSVDLVAGTPWLWAREPMHGRVDTLFVDEAGQVSLANVVSISGAARNVVLLGDPQQLDQPTQGVHPDGSGKSALGHFLGEAKVVPEDRGLFLEKTWRMHPQITRYTSELFYEDKLHSIDGLERQRIEGAGWLAGSGLRWAGVDHDGNTNESLEEALAVVDIVRELLGRNWTNKDGVQQAIVKDEIRVLTPYNAHRLLIDDQLAKAGISGVQVGTVDKFQGQEAAVAIYTMATSRPEDAPRGMDFLYSLHRLNVATSRAKALAIVVASPLLLRAVPQTPEQLRMANGLAAFVEHALPRTEEVPVPPESSDLAETTPAQLALPL